MLVLFRTPKFGAQAMRKTAALGWKPLRIVDINSATILKPLGAAVATGVISSNVEKDALDPASADDRHIKGYRALMKNTCRASTPDDYGRPLGYGIAFVMVGGCRSGAVTT
jgi:branched-chain amino acid transport system substrate-binding protein